MLTGRLVDRASFDTVMVPADSPLLPELVAADRPLDTALLGRDLVPGEPLLAVGGVGVGRTFTVPVDADMVEGLGLIPGDRLDVIGLVEVVDDGGDRIEVLDFVAVDVEVTRLPGESSGAFAAATADSWVTPCSPAFSRPWAGSASVARSPCRSTPMWSRGLV